MALRMEISLMATRGHSFGRRLFRCRITGRVLALTPTCCGRRLRLLLANRPLLRAIDAAIGSQSWQVAILLRLNALVPFNFQSYFLGATDIGLVPYVITTLFGIMPFATMYVYLGSVGRTIAIEEGFGASSIALLFFSLLATATLIYFVGTRQSGSCRK
jgi:uncharacterized membrane protein YdjX (TVP38/TMEM64 family)